MSAPYPVDLYPGCPCYTCDADPTGYVMRMALCPTCGNKRCPGAANHTNACSGSNEPRQKHYPAASADPRDAQLARLRANILDLKE